MSFVLLVTTHSGGEGGGGNATCLTSYISGPLPLHRVLSLYSLQTFTQVIPSSMNAFPPPLLPLGHYLFTKYFFCGLMRLFYSRKGVPAC